MVVCSGCALADNIRISRRVLVRLLWCDLPSIIAVAPFVVAAITRIPMELMSFGGTGMIIVVGVALETMKQIEAHLVMRHYEGFLK